MEERTHINFPIEDLIKIRRWLMYMYNTDKKLMQIELAYISEVIEKIDAEITIEDLI